MELKRRSFWLGGGGEPTRCSLRVRGVTVLEILISIFILLFGIISILAVFPTALRINSRTTEITSSAWAAKSIVDELLASQVYAFPSGVAEAIDKSDSGLRSVISPKFDRQEDHKLPYFNLWDDNILWGDLVDIVKSRRARDYILIKKNSPGDAEQRRVESIKTIDDRKALIKIDCEYAEDAEWYDLDLRETPDDEMPSSNPRDYLDRSEFWIWPVREGARYWLGNFREDRTKGRFPAYARVKAVTSDEDGLQRLVCEVVQEGVDVEAGSWGPPNWESDCWKGFVLIHTGEHQDIVLDEEGEKKAWPTVRAAAVDRVYLITGNSSGRIECSRADFEGDGIQAGDYVRIAGNAAGRVWWPEDFLGPGSFYDSEEGITPEDGLYRTQPVGTGSEYSYGCVFSGWENDIPNLYRVDIFIYRNFDSRKPPEENIPIARYGTLLSGR